MEPRVIGDVANSRRPLLIIAKVQLSLRVLPVKVRRRCFFFFFFAGKTLGTAQTQFHLYSEQQRAFGISNICYYFILLPVSRNIQGTYCHVNTTKSYLHFYHFTGKAFLCSNFFCFSLFLHILRVFLSYV